jgi:hypothetical protein
MRKTYTMVIVAALLTAPPVALAADKCPPELAQAKAMLGKASSAPSKTTAARQETQPPRQLAGAKIQDVQAPRSSTQDVQAPRSSTQDVQAPRSSTQDVQAPRSSTQDVQAPRGQTAKAGDTPQDIQVPRSPDEKARLDKAGKLVSDSEAACKKGDITLSTSKAKEAMGLLK